MARIGNTLEAAILHKLVRSTGHVIDLAYAAVVHQLGLSPRFFPQGFGELEAIDMHADVEAFSQWPPPHFDAVSKNLEWQIEREGAHLGHAYRIYKAAFPTPCQGRVFDALPPESRQAQALLIQPVKPAEGSPSVVHLAATGDHGFARRAALGLPLVKHGISTVALESPFYGPRKPQGQTGSKLRHVSDLLLLGRASIEESLFLLQWLAGEGRRQLGVSGLSMGGVHACMVASLYPEPLALTPLLAPRSAAAAYCRGALYHATAWDPLLEDSKKRASAIAAALDEAARSTDRLAAARSSSPSVMHDAASASGKAAAERSSAVQQPPQPGNNISWTAIGTWVQNWYASLGSQLQAVGKLESAHRTEAAVALLAQVLETYTDVTRFPVPSCPEAAVLVAATEDAYVSRESVLELQRHLPGSSIRWVPGGHVSSFLFHQEAFRTAILDSLHKLKKNCSEEGREALGV